MRTNIKNMHTMSELDQLLLKCNSITKCRLQLKKVFQIFFSVTFAGWYKIHNILSASI